MKALRTQNYYDILGVTASATSEEIRRAYELSKVTFQENSLATYSLFTDEENQEILGLISRAFETLFNPQLRREYDDFLTGLKEEGDPQAWAGEFVPKTGQHPLQTDIIATKDPLNRPSFARISPQHPPTHQSTARPAREYRPEQLTADAPEQVSLQTDAQRPEPAPPPSPPEPAEKIQNKEALEQYLETVTVFTGPVLKKIRELHGLTLENIAEHTKIRKTYIKYMEDEEFTFLPAKIYVKGFVTLIARVFDLPTDRVSTDYMNTYFKNDSQ